MNRFKRFTFALVMASEGNPVLSTLTIAMFYLFVNLFEGQVERLIFGERFEHFIDPIISASFIIFAAYAVWCCAVYNTQEPSE